MICRVKYKIPFCLFALSLFSRSILVDLHADVSLNPNTDVKRVKKIAVVPFSNDALGYRHTGEWETILIANGYNLVERGSIESILKEQRLSLTGMVNPNQASKIGELLGVDGIVMGRESRQKPFMGESSNGLNLVAVLMEPPPSSVKLLDMQTGQVIWQFTPKKESEASPVVNPTDTFEYLNQLRKQLKKGGWDQFPYSTYQVKDTNRTGVQDIAALTYVAFSSHRKHIHNSRIAVYPFKVDTQSDSSENLNGDTLADDMGNALISAGYDVIERTQLEEIIKEQKMNLTGAIRQEDMVKLGEIAGIQGMVFGSAYGQPEKFGYSAKLVDVESGELYWSVYGAVSFNQLSKIVKSFLKKNGVPAESAPMPRKTSQSVSTDSKGFTAPPASEPLETTLPAATTGSTVQDNDDPKSKKE